MASKTFSSEKAKKPHLVQDGKGGLPGEIADLRSDVELAAQRLEGRPAASEFPEIDWIDGGAAAAGGDTVIKGRYLLQGQAFASVTLGASLEIIACVPGLAGNDYSAEVIDSAAGGLTVAMPADKLTIDLGGATPDEDTIATAINNSGAANYQILRANSGGGAAFGTAAEASLTGGSGDGWECLVTGVAAPIKHTTGGATSTANLTETAVTVTVPDLTALGDARAIGDEASVSIRTDGVKTQQAGATLV